MEKNGPTDILTYQEGMGKICFLKCVSDGHSVRMCSWSTVEYKDNHTILLCRAESDMVSIRLLDVCTEGGSLDCKIHPIM